MKKVICLSTDKAAYPINAMGISKAMMEKVAVAESRNLKRYCCVSYKIWKRNGIQRFCNSIVLSQIQKVNPITITDPNMSRFFMSLEDAVDLVLFALKTETWRFIRKQSTSWKHWRLGKSINRTYRKRSASENHWDRHGEKL